MLDPVQIEANMIIELENIRSRARQLASMSDLALDSGLFKEAGGFQVESANLSSLYVNMALQVLDLFENSDGWDEDEWDQGGWGADPDDAPDCECNGSCGEACSCKEEEESVDDEG